MAKIAAVAVLVLFPLLWGALMVPVLDFIENRLSRKSTDDGAEDE